MHTRSLAICVAAVLFLTAACSNNSTSTHRDEADRNPASDRKSDSAEPVDAAARPTNPRRRRRDSRLSFTVRIGGDALAFALSGHRAGSDSLC